MAVEKIGLNLSAAKNITVPEYNTSKTAADYLKEIPEIANETTGYFFGFGVLFALLAVTYHGLREPEQNSGFGYDEGQSFALSSSIVFIFGLLFVMVGFIQNFMPVGIMGGVFLSMQLIISYINNTR